MKISVLLMLLAAIFTSHTATAGSYQPDFAGTNANGIVVRIGIIGDDACTSVPTLSGITFIKDYKVQSFWPRQTCGIATDGQGNRTFSCTSDKADESPLSGAVYRVNEGAGGSKCALTCISGCTESTPQELFPAAPMPIDVG